MRKMITAFDRAWRDDRAMALKNAARYALGDKAKPDTCRPGTSSSARTPCRAHLNRSQTDIRLRSLYDRRLRPEANEDSLRSDV